MTDSERRLAGAICVTLAITAASCSDDGRPVTGFEDLGDGGPRLVPMRTLHADTVSVEGGAFGDEPLGRSIAFTRQGGGTTDAELLSWSDGEIRLVVPDDATTGEVFVFGTGAAGATTLFFELAPRRVPYAAVDSVFRSPAGSCVSCHAGIAADANFDLSSRAALLAGTSDNGPAVRARRGSESMLIRKMNGTADFGTNMPYASAPLPDAAILLITDWIDQGARP